MLPGQTPYDRPDLIARVFHLKFKSLLDDIMNKQIFGKAVGYVYTVEYQKQGLPHTHSIIFLDRLARLATSQAVDAVISTEFPNHTQNPRLFELVQHMTHRPCGGRFKCPCMNDQGLCTKGFPKPFQEETLFTGESYVKTRRRHTDIQHHICGADLDNRWIVSYCPFLLSKYESHINVECTTGFNAVKYIYKVTITTKGIQQNQLTLTLSMFTKVLIVLRLPYILIVLLINHFQDHPINSLHN